MTTRFRPITINTLTSVQDSSGQWTDTPVLLRNGQAKVMDVQSDYQVLDNTTRVYQERARFLIRNTLANYDIAVNNQNYAIGYLNRFYKVLDVKETGDQQFLIMMCESQANAEAL